MMLSVHIDHNAPSVLACKAGDFKFNIGIALALSLFYVIYYYLTTSKSQDSLGPEVRHAGQFPCRLLSDAYLLLGALGHGAVGAGCCVFADGQLGWPRLVWVQGGVQLGETAVAVQKGAKD